MAAVMDLLPTLKTISPHLRSTYQHVPYLLTPVHPYLPFGPIDLFGAMRLSSVVNWMASGVFDSPPSSINGAGGKTGKDKSKKLEKPRASVLQECFGILVVVFGGETFLAMCTNTTPSWLSSPKIPLLFAVTHIIQTRTPLKQYLPSRPTLLMELILSIPDAIGRALLLTKFSVLPLLQHPNPSLPLSPSTLLLTPFIIAVPFASLIFSGTNWFSPNPSLSVPMELSPWGWTAVDAWAPVVVPAMFLSLIGPVKGWSVGIGIGEEEAIVICIVFVWICFVGRTIYNLGYKREQWAEMFRNTGTTGKKIKTA